MAAEQILLPVLDQSAQFAVRSVLCIGRNYAEHALEMGADPTREPPFFFMKAASNLVPGGGAVAYPPRTAALEHEVELVVAIGRGGENIPVAAALDHIFGYAVGLDMTRRDLQAQAKQARRPWDAGKSFDGAAPIGVLAQIPHDAAARARISLYVNGALKQHGSIADMIWSIAEIIAELSTYQALAPGDLIFTGTPAGVGPVVPGDRLKAVVEGLPELETTIAAPRKLGA